jgi:E3 ubiquitin-protein ligase TRIP12
MLDQVGAYMQHPAFFSSLFNGELTSDLDKYSPTNDVLFLLKSLEGLNRFIFHLMSRERIHAFAEGLIDNLGYLKVAVRPVSQNEFVSCKLTEKLEQQMRDSLAVSIGGMPVWCNQLMDSCSFLFSFEARCKYFRLSAFGRQQVQPQPSSHNNSGVSRDGPPSAGSLSRKKFLVLRDRVLESAAQMMDSYAHVKAPIEVEYNEEVGTGLGPTLEFYTLVSREFQKSGLGMWRQDHISFTTSETLQAEYSGIVNSSFGLFPRPWPSSVDASDAAQFSEVIKKFFLLGQIVAKALQDGRVLDLPFSKAFYKLILQQVFLGYGLLGSINGSTKASH